MSSSVLVSADRTAAVVLEKKTGSCDSSEGIFLVQGIAAVRINIRNFLFSFSLLINT